MKSIFHTGLLLVLTGCAAGLLSFMPAATAGKKGDAAGSGKVAQGAAQKSAQKAALNAAPKAMLVFSKTTGFRHDCIPAGKLAMLKLGAIHGYQVDTTEDASAFTKENLKKYKVVMFLCTTGTVLDSSQKLAFEQFIEGGGGFVGIHSATDTEYNWPWYGKLVGAWFRNHPSNSPLTGKLHVEDRHNPSTREMPVDFSRSDEWYNFKYVNPDDHILVTIDQTTYNSGATAKNIIGDDKKHPVSWCHTYAGGRAFYTSMGHLISSFEEPLFLNHVWGGIQYAAGKN